MLRSLRNGADGVVSSVQLYGFAALTTPSAPIKEASQYFY